MAVVDVGVAGPGILCQQGGRAHDLPALAVAALRHVVADPCGLQGLADAVRVHRLDRGHLLAGHRLDRGHAGTYRLAVDVHRAGTAAAMPQPNLVPV